MRVLRKIEDLIRRSCLPEIRGTRLVNTKTVSACLLQTNIVFNQKIQFNLPVDSSNPVNITDKMEGEMKGVRGGDGNQQKRDNNDARRDSILPNARLIIFSTDTPTTS